MVVRLRIRIKRENRVVEAIAIANSGYASRVPELVISRSIAEELGIYPNLPPNTRIVRYRTASGRIEEFLRIENCAEVQIVEPDRVSDSVRVNVVISPYISICLLSDKLISALKIVLIDAGEGLWCFRDELGKRVRTSV